MMDFTPNPELDLCLERVVDVPPSAVWAAWTTPEQILTWFTPAPFTTVDCEIDLRPGGIFRTVMRSPDGDEFTNIGCYLEVIDGQRLVWTSTLGPGYRPTTDDDLPFTAVITLEPAEVESAQLSAGQFGTKYTALVIHGDPAVAARHAEMGFHQGWGAALDQLVAMVKSTNPAK